MVGRDLLVTIKQNSQNLLDIMLRVLDGYDKE